MKAAREQDFRVCPSCGARNKAKWEYCVRCSESLADVPLGAPGAAAAAAASPDVVADYDEGLPWGSIFGTLVLLAIAVSVYRLAGEPPAAPPPNAFTVGTIPQALPSSPPAAQGRPGREEYDEGIRRLTAGDEAGAVDMLARATSLDSDNDVYRNAYGVALFAFGSKEDAVDQYRAALRLAPRNSTYRLNLAKALVSVGRKDEAMAEFERMMEGSPHGDALQEVAQMVAESDPARARDLLRRAAALQPQNAVLKQQLASILEKTGDVDGATRMYSEVLATNPEAHITRGLLAEIHLKQGRSEEALALFRSGLQEFPNAALLHRGLASALERSGALAEAIAEYREYARLAPNAADAAQLRERADRLERRAAAENS